MINFSSLFRIARSRTSLVVASATFGAMALSAPLSAQPSGGPYGPIQQRYEVPQAKKIFYVAPDGQGSAAGSSLERPTSFASAIERAETGDAIIARGGVYRTGGLRLSQGITIQPYADERPIIKGTEVAKEWTAQPNGMWRTSWKKLFPAKPADWWRRDRNARQTPLHLFNNDMVFLDGVLLNAVGGEHEIDEKSFYIDYENGNIYIGANPENRLVEITAYDGFLVRTITDAHGKKNDGKGLIMRGLTLTQYAYRALEIEGTEPEKYMDPSNFGKEIVGSALEHLTISFCSRVAGYFRGDNLVIRNCLISDNGTEGIYVINSADVLIEKNIITRTNIENIRGYFASAVKIFNQSYRTICRQNLVIDNPNASGIWWDVGNVDGVFVNNWIERTNDGFFFEISKGAICAGNVFVNCNKGIRILNSSNVQVYQNTFFNSLASFERTERSAVGDHFGWHPSTGPDVAERHGHVFVNNLLAADESFKGPLLEYRQSAAVKDRLKDPHAKEYDANVYVRRAGMIPQPLVSYGPVQNEKNLVEIKALEELRSLHPNFEVKGLALPDYRGPLFRGMELGNFELLASSPAAKTGAPLPAHIRTLLGWKEGTFPGAYAPIQ
jgi:parallel beta-helix repeat protein